MSAITDWLLSENDWIAYRTRIDLLNENISEKEEYDIMAEILKTSGFNLIVNDLKNWPGEVVKRHNDSKLLIHKLAFLADAGIKRFDPQLPEIISKIKSTISDDGIYPVPINLPERFGGSGEEELLWMLCDAPLILYSLSKMGLSEDPDIISATRYLVRLQDENSWRCKASSKLGSFGGPGRKGDPCPYANLLMLKLISQSETGAYSTHAEKGINAILGLWRDQGKRKERMFGIGTDFRKPKAPLIWFDIIHVLDTLSNYKIVYNNESYIQMLDELKSLFDEEGKLTPQSIYLPWKSWEFSNKKAPSRWLTFLAYRIISRTENR